MVFAAFYTDMSFKLFYSLPPKIEHLTSKSLTYRHLAISPRRYVKREFQECYYKKTLISRQLSLFYHSFARWSVINIAVGNYSLITSRRKENKRKYYLLDRDWPQNFVSTTKCCKPSKIYSIVLRYFPCFQCCFFSILHFI